MTRRQRTKRRAQRWARRRSLPSERARIARRRRWLQPHLVTFPALNMDDAHITHIGDVPLDVPIPIAAWQLPEHETHWLANASLDPAKFEDGRFPAFVNENTVEPIEMGMCGGVTHDMLRYTDQARQLIIDTCGVDPYTVEPIPARADLPRNESPTC